MAFKKSAIAIDIGAHTIRAMCLTVSAAGLLVEKALVIERSELLVDGWEPGNLEQLARMIAARMSDQKISTRGVVLGIGSQDCMMRYTRIPPVPSWRLKVIMGYEVGEVAEKIGEPLSSGYRPLQLAREAGEDQTILIGLAKEKPLEALVDALESAGITVQMAVPNPVALFAAHDAFGQKADPETAEDDLVLLADLGAESLSLALVLNDKLAFARNISFGGKNFTESLASSLGVDFAQAEKLKISKGGVDENERGVHHDTVAPLRSAAGQLLGMLQSSIRFASTQIGVPLPSLSRVVLAGGGSRLRGLQTFLTKGLGKPVDLFRPQSMRGGSSLAQPAASILADRPGDFALALGLGASLLRDVGDDPARTALSILPGRYMKRREFRDRTFLHAAGVLLAVLLFARIGQAIHANVQANGVFKNLQATQVKLAGMKQELEATRSEAEKRKTRLNRLLKESEQTAFQAFVLDLLSRVLRPEFQIEKISLARDETKDEVSYDYNLRIGGRVNNEKRQGLDWILELQSALKGEDRIASVEVESSNPDGAWYTFEISVRPNYVSY